MGLKLKLCGGTKNADDRTVHIVLGFFFIFNYCIASGFTGTPYTFFYSGYLAALPTLLVITFISWISSNYILEVTARAQALEYLDTAETASGVELGETAGDKQLLTDNITTDGHPRFEITHERKYELSELCDIFFNKYVKFAYLVVMVVYLLLSNWTVVTMAGSAWAINSPFHFGAMEICSQNAFMHTTLPAVGCLYTYYLFVSIFGVIVSILALFDLKELVIIQMIIGILRFITLGAILIYCITRLSKAGDACNDILQLNNTTTPINVDMSSVALKFDPKGWLVSIPVFTYMMLFQTVIPSAIHPIKQKRYLHWLVFAVALVSMLCYMSVGVVVSLWFRASIQENCTLNWAIFTRFGNPAFIRILSYCIILFPTIDVLSSYVLANVVIINNLYILITGQDTALPPKFRFDWILRILLRLAGALLPVLGSFLVANLIYVLKFSGLVGFIALIAPYLLQLKSIYVCKKKFSTFMAEYKVYSKDKDSKKKDKGSKFKHGPLLHKDKDAIRRRYMTPYSHPIFSHPVFVGTIMSMAVCQFILSVVSLFVHPNKMSCELIKVEIF